MIIRIALAAAVLAAGVATPADAQRTQRYVEVFGNDKCPEPTSSGEIVVCGKLPESDRYRIPTELREAAPSDRETQEARVDEMIAVGRTGTDSCSVFGPGGFTGCFQQQVQANKAERRTVRRARQEEPR